MKQPISLVLSGGAARGIAHIGVIEELEKNNFEIKSIAGNSMGLLLVQFTHPNNCPNSKNGF